MTAYKTTYNFTAILSLFPTENGGRKRPVYNHYRPSFSFGTKIQFSGEVSFPGLEELQPGGTTTANVKLLSSRHIRQNLKSGDPFTILEGDKIVGTGVIQEIQQENRVPVTQ
jgi:translation elongation factor EF-Tu-like GTPase